MAEVKRIRPPSPSPLAVADPGAAHLDRADPGLHLARRHVAMTDHAAATLVVDQMLVCGQEGRNLRIDRAGQQLARAGAQNLRQRVVNRNLLWMAERNNTIVVHGVSFLRGNRRLDIARIRRLLLNPSPTFDYSSRLPARLCTASQRHREVMGCHAPRSDPQQVPCELQPLRRSHLRFLSPTNASNSNFGPKAYPPGSGDGISCFSSPG